MDNPANHYLSRQATRDRRGPGVWGRLLAISLILLLPGLLGAWRAISGETINPRYVERIKDGVTKKHEVLLFFGDPKEIERTEDGQVYKYFSYKDAPAEVPKEPNERKIAEQSDQIYLLDADKKIRKPTVKKEGKILRSSLTIRFKKDGDTVMSHEYKEF